MNRNLVQERLRYRMENLRIRVDQKTTESNKLIALLEEINRSKNSGLPRLMLDPEVPAIEINALDRLLKTDYVRPVVERATRLQKEIQTGSPRSRFSSGNSIRSPRRKAGGPAGTSEERPRWSRPCSGSQ